MTTVLITGGSGLVGGHLTELLVAEGFAVRHLSRSAKLDAAVPTFAWDISSGHVDPSALENVDHIIHLSGAGIADKRWTPRRMAELYSSRSGAADVLRTAVETRGNFPKSFISASGINYYGAVTTEHVFIEDDPPANDTIGKLTKAWEDAADSWSPHCRVVKLRTAVVLAREGGALPKLAAPARWGLASPLGSGKQWIPWVHIEDLARIYLHAIRNNEMQGTYNIAAPEHVQNRDFMCEVAQVLHRPFLLPKVPAFALLLLLGGPSELILDGSRVSNSKVLASGFEFRHPQLNAALTGLLS